MSSPGVASNSFSQQNRTHLLRMVLTCLMVIVFAQTTATWANAAPAALSVQAVGSTASVEKFNINVKADAGKSVPTGTVSWTQGGQRLKLEPSCVIVNGANAWVAARMPAGNSTSPHLAIFSVTDNGANDVLSLEIVITGDLCGTGVASEPVNGKVIVEAG